MDPIEQPIEKLVSEVLHSYIKARDRLALLRDFDPQDPLVVLCYDLENLLRHTATYGSSPACRRLFSKGLVSIIKATLLERPHPRAPDAIKTDPPGWETADPDDLPGYQ